MPFMPLNLKKEEQYQELQNLEILFSTANLG